VDEEFIIREFKKAQEAGHESMQGFLAKHLNVEMGLSLKSQRWAGADFWEAAGGSVTLDTILERSEVVVVGVDPGGLDDLIGFAVLGRDRDNNDKWWLWNKAWAHKIAMERRKSEITKYRDLEKCGDLVFVDKMEDAYSQLMDIVMKIEDVGLLDRIGTDAHDDNRRLIDECRRRGIERSEKDKPERVVGVEQGWRLFSAIHDLECTLSDKNITHAGQLLMQWCVGNARVVPKGNAIAITKEASGTGKIDPLMATFNAVALMALNPTARRVVSAYEGQTKEEILRGMAF
jgi:phage terminase large subunit-like protein